MQAVWKMTLETFVGTFKVDDSDLEELDLVFDRYVNKNAASWILRSMRKIPRHPGFLIADIRGRRKDVALIHEESVYGDKNLVGGYVDEVLWIDRGIRGRGLSSQLILAKFEKSGSINPMTYTTAGRKAHIAAHRMAVVHALAEGRNLPIGVMRAYPDLHAINT